jgi:hypothetical protein
MLEGFSKYFTFEAMTNSTSYPKAVDANRKEAVQFIKAGKRLSKMMESVRLFLGVPLKESSGFRGKTLTAMGKFSKTSVHTKFEALDVIPIGMSVDDAFEKVKANKHLFPDLRRVIKEKIGGKEWLHFEVKMSADEPQVFAIMTDSIKYQVVG